MLDAGSAEGTTIRCLRLEKEESPHRAASYAPWARLHGRGGCGTGADRSACRNTLPTMPLSRRGWRCESKGGVTITYSEVVANRMFMQILRLVL